MLCRRNNGGRVLSFCELLWEDRTKRFPTAARAFVLAVIDRIKVMVTVDWVRGVRPLILLPCFV